MEKLENTKVIPRHSLEWPLKRISKYNMHTGSKCERCWWETWSCILLGIFSWQPGRGCETKLTISRRNTYMFSFCSLQRFGSIVKKLCSTQGCPILCPRCYLEKRTPWILLKGLTWPSSDDTLTSLQLLVSYSTSKICISDTAMTFSGHFSSHSKNCRFHQESCHFLGAEKMALPVKCLLLCASMETCVQIPSTWKNCVQ